MTRCRSMTIRYLSTKVNAYDLLFECNLRGSALLRTPARMQGLGSKLSTFCPAFESIEPSHQRFIEGFLHPLSHEIYQPALERLRGADQHAGWCVLKRPNMNYTGSHCLARPNELRRGLNFLKRGNDGYSAALPGKGCTTSKAPWSLALFFYCGIPNRPAVNFSDKAPNSLRRGVDEKFMCRDSRC